MKRTTYVILGVLLALLAGMSGTVIYWGTHSGSASDMTLRLEGEERVRPLPACKVIRFQTDKTLYKYDDCFTLNSAHLIVTPADTATGSFSYAADMEEFMSFKAHGDTLDVVFSFPPEKLRKRMPEGKIVPSFILQTSPFSLRLPENVECLKGEMLYAVELQDLQRDSLAIDFSDSPATVFVQNSRFRALSVLARQLDLVSGSVEHLHLDIDKLHDSRFEVKTDSFCIDTEYLSGYKAANFRADPQECRRILWNPLSENARLKLEMKSRSEILLRE